MKVVLLSAANSIHSIRWANGLVGAGIDLTLVTQHEPLESLNEQVRVQRLPYSGTIGYFSNVPALKRMLNNEHPTLLHAHYASGYGTMARLSRYHPYMLSVWGSDVYSVPERSRFHRWLVRKNLLAADHVTSTSHVMAKQAESIVSELNDIAVVPFGIDVDMFRKNEDEYSSGKSDIVVGTVKTLEPTYGIDTLLESFALLVSRLRSTRPKVASRLRLRIVGGGGALFDLKRTANQLDIADRTEFVGRVDHDTVPDELRKLDVYVALSRSESFGVAVLEASACGLPVVVSDVGGLPEVVVEGVTGYVVPPENPQAAANALETLVLDLPAREEMGEKGRNHVEANYQWGTSIRKMIAVYEQTRDNAH